MDGVAEFVGKVIEMTLENKKIVHLAELNLSKADLDKLGEDEFAFLSTLAFAVDEISVFQKLSVQAYTKAPADGDLRVLHQIQVNTITRVLCAKLFEAIGLFDGFVKMVARRGDVATAKKLREYQSELTTLKDRDEYSLAKIIRDCSTNHYLPSETKKNIKFVSPRFKFAAFLHENQGNSFYPFGEEVVFLGRVSRYFSEEKEQDFCIEDIHDWLKWSMEVSRWLHSMLSDYILWLHKEKFPKWVLKKKTPYLEVELFAELGHTPLPLFFSADKYSRNKTKEE